MQKKSEKTITETEKNADSKSPGKEKSNNRYRKFLLIILLFGIVVGAFKGIRWLHYYFTHAITDDARVKGNLISVSPTVQGKIRLFPVQEGNHVKRGQLIAQLREEDYQAQVDMASGSVKATEAALIEARADLIMAKENTEKLVQQATSVLNASKARLKEAKAELLLAKLNFDRTVKLYKSKSISASEMDKVASSFELARAKVVRAEEEINENKAKLKVAVANTGEVELKQKRLESSKGELEEVKAKQKAERLKLAHTTVTSPIDGVVAKKIANIGEVVKPGQPVCYIIDLNNIWLEANLEETKVKNVRLGQPVDLKVDAYPETEFTGKVISIGATAASEFSLIPEGSSTGNFTKVTQRIPIRIEVADPAKQLRPGMMVVVGIDIRDNKQ